MLPRMSSHAFGGSLAQGLQKHVVVVGAGIVGASTAWHLARRGFAVTLVDREAPRAIMWAAAQAGRDGR